VMIFLAYKKTCWIFLVLASVLFHGAYAQELHFQAKDLNTNILQVADYYARSGDFKEAILQYYEFLYRFPNDTLVPQITIRLASVYQESGNYKLAEKHLKEALVKYNQTKYDLENRLRLAFLYYEKEDYSTAIDYALKQPEEPFRLVEIYCWIRLGEIEDADSLVASFDTEGYSTEIIAEYGNLRTSNARLNWMRKYGAYTLSALLPGTGRILMDEYKDGILTAVGFYGLVKVAAYMLQSHPAFYYYAATGTLIYYGLNMYATHFAVQRFTDRIMKQNLLRLTEIYPLSEQLHLPLPY